MKETQSPRYKVPRGYAYDLNMNVNSSNESQRKIPPLYIFIQNPMISDEQRLFESLFKNYRKALRPLRKGSEILTVSFSLVIKDIFDVDERNQVLKMNVQLNESWVDQILHWNPEEFGGISELRIPASEIWIPDITLYNTGDSAVLAQGNITSSNVILRYDGFIRLTTKPFVQHSTCLLSIRYFPFDVQTCKLKFGSWTFDQRLVDLVNGTPGPLYSDFEQNEQWHLEYAFFKRHVLFYVCCPQRYVDVTLCMGLKRKPQYYIHKLVMPILLLSALSMVGFLMPYNVGVVKANLSISLFLSMTVFLLLVAETIPRTSSELPIVTQYYISIMILIALSTGMNIAILNIFHLGKESAQNVPRWMRRAVFFYLARIMLMEDIVAYWKKSVKRHPQKNKDAAEREAVLRRQRWFASRYGIKYNPKENVLINNLKTDSGSTESLLHDENSHMEQEENLSEYEHIDEKIPIIWRVRLKNIEGSVSNVHQHMIGAHKKRTKLQKSKREWALVATVMDRLFFIIYSTTTISVTFYILMWIPRWQVPLNVNDCV
ncbi:putative neuronal acetylcholine receptor subunit alpha-10 [Apostichopus japonicus]|uniref:Putative neuronal acetylcholine receptor subunit alpha-10 n=1 Tax=Stichopus japonicus TaxID=307972 RepID=A0A2G8KCH8_STIJA|nr:putative neuronal acetylcholine receptor subunit alpha-10 [Apostichopus japonicus]